MPGNNLNRMETGLFPHIKEHIQIQTKEKRHMALYFHTYTYTQQLNC